MSAVKLMKKEEEVDVPVTWEDQKNINKFSTFNAKLADLEFNYSKLSKEKEYLDDLVTEMELFDEDEFVRYKIGDAFVSIPFNAAQERLEKETSSVSSRLDSIQTTIDETKKNMEKLKTALYAKFGKAINLDR